MISVLLCRSLQIELGMNVASGRGVYKPLLWKVHFEMKQVEIQTGRAPHPPPNSWVASFDWGFALALARLAPHQCDFPFPPWHGHAWRTFLWLHRCFSLSSLKKIFKKTLSKSLKLNRVSGIVWTGWRLEVKRVNCRTTSCLVSTFNPISFRR